jgi:hypothetical protein
MPKAPCTFRLSDANRLIGIAKKNSLANYRVEFERGKIALIVGEPDRSDDSASDLDRELAEFESRKTWLE